MVKNVDSSSFEAQVLKNKNYVLLEFSAAWCGPCKQMFPILGQVSELYEDELDVFKIDIDENPDIALKYQVKNIPLLLLIKDGTVVSQKTGALPKTKLVEWLDENIK